jgi:hypothetical protein
MPGQRVLGERESGAWGGDLKLGVAPPRLVPWCSVIGSGEPGPMPCRLVPWCSTSASCGSAAYDGCQLGLGIESRAKASSTSRLSREQVAT